LLTRIPVREWLDESDEVIETVLDIYQKRAEDAKRRK